MKNQTTDNILYVHPKPQKLTQLHEVKDSLQWWTHPETIDWEAHRASESQHWLALDNRHKGLERFEQLMANGVALNSRQIAEYNRLES